MPDVEPQIQTTPAVQEQPSPPVQPESAPAKAPAAAPKAPDLASEYELGDLSVDPQIDSPTAAAGAPAPAESPQGAQAGDTSPATSPDRPRDPETGRFVPQAPRPPDRLVQRALEVGLSQQDIASLSPEALDEAVWVLSRRQAQQPVQQPQQPQQPVQQQPADFDLDPKQYDEGLVKAFGAMKARLAQLENFAQTQVRETVADQIEHSFEKHEAVLGKGRPAHRGGTIQPSDPFHHRRKAVIDLANTLKGSIPERIDRAVETLFGQGSAGKPALPSSALPPGSPLSEAWANGGVMRPTQRNGAAEPRGDRKAEKSAAAFMKERGMLDDEGESKDGFLP